MTITPAGFPPWLRTSDLTTYGGNAQKQNHLGQGVIDALTDVGAEEFSRLAADFAAVMRTAPAATLLYTCNDSPSGAPTVELVWSMVGVRASSYLGSAAPTGYPSAARVSNGVVDFTFPSTYTDPYGVASVLRIRNPRASVCSVLGVASCELLSDSIVRVSAFGIGGAALVSPQLTLTVHSG